MTINTKQSRESAFGDNATISPDGNISAGDRQSILGGYPLGAYDVGATGLRGAAVYFPAMEFRAFAGESKGMSGTGSFAFQVIENERKGRVLVLLKDVSFKTENRADKAYRELIGENAAPKAQVFEDDDTDIA